MSITDQQTFTIQYLPSIFASVGVTSELIIDSELREIPPDITVAKTERKWATYMDDIKTQRNIQSFYERKFKVVFFTHQSVDCMFLELSQNVELQIGGEIEIDTDFGDTFMIYNVNMNYNEVTDEVWRVEMTFNFKEIEQISNFLASDYVYETGLYNTLSITIENPVYDFYKTLTPVTGGHMVTLDYENEFSELVARDKFYWHTEIPTLLDDKENFGFAEIQFPVGDEIQVRLFNGIASGTFQGRVILNNIPDDQELSTNVSDMQFYLYTMLQPEFEYETINEDIITTQENIEYNEKITSKEYIVCNFYIPKTEKWKIKYLNLASSLSFTDRKNSKTYQIIQIKDSFEIVDRGDLTQLYEIKFKGLISNLTSKQIY